MSLDMIIMYYLDKSDWIPKPTIIADNNGRTSLAETLVLNCTVITEPEVLFEMKWLHNGTEIKVRRLY